MPGLMDILNSYAQMQSGQGGLMGANLNEDQMKAMQIKNALQGITDFGTGLAQAGAPNERGQNIGFGAALAGASQYQDKTQRERQNDQFKNLYMMAQAKKDMTTNSGGATGDLVDRLMKENPKLSFRDALYQVQTGFRQGTQYDENGSIALTPGYAGTRGTLKNVESRGTARGKATGEAEGANDASTVNAPKLQELINKAKGTLPQASSGLSGSVSAGLKGLVGYSDDATKADKQLEVISAGLTASVPRFEGPQGVLDVQLYKQAAGDVANRSIPRADRLAALATMEQLNKKYMPKGGAAKSPTATPTTPAMPAAQPKFLGFE